MFWLAKWERFAFPIFFPPPSQKRYRKNQFALLNYL